MLFFMPHEQNSESACKPGSVKNGHLSVACDCSQAQATSRERPGRPYALSAVLLRIEFTAPACPCPVEPGLSSRTGFRLVPAAVRLTRAAILIEKKTFVNIILVNKVQKRYNL